MLAKLLWVAGRGRSVSEIVVGGGVGPKCSEIGVAGRMLVELLWVAGWGRSVVNLLWFAGRGQSFCEIVVGGGAKVLVELL